MVTIILAATVAVMVANSMKCRYGSTCVVVGLIRICKSEIYMQPRC